MGWWATACARAGQRTFFFNAVILIFGTATCELAWPDASSDCRDTYFLSLKIESKCETQHTLPLGAGIAAPTNTTNPLENPAGFIYNFKPKVHVSYSTLSHDDGAPTRTGFLAATGNGFLGGGVSYSSYKSSQNYVGSPSAKQLGFGFANAIDPANLAAGLVFFRSVESNPAFDAIRNISRNPVNFGTLLNPKGKVKFGGTLFDLLNGVVAGGLGVATNFSEQTA
ncbi:MAG: hypothetical protein HY074_14230, partial [Deltaproteobacteria bacterium]|nr:hypothetical protein [Deltaproteobacteria bacterium]